MKLMALGLTRSGEPRFPPVDGEAFTEMLLARLEANAGAVAALARGTSIGAAFKGEVERESLDPGDPRRSGWAFLVNPQDPRRQAYERVLAPLAARRGMADPGSPLLYNGEPPEAWFDWLNDNYFALKLEGKRPPQYILIAGGPDQVPFRFQSLLSTVANVGRVDFETLADLQHYVEKLIRLETAAEPAVSREAVVFAPDAGPQDATYFSQEYMAKPLAGHIRDSLGLEAVTILGKDATKQRLLETLTTRTPALVYTASHGLAPDGGPEADQRRYNGAICCQHSGPPSGALTPEALFTADDVPLDRPFLEGAVFFQFACFGYGTPAESDYAHWVDGIPQKYGETDFVAALPRRLLAHSKGPIAYVGHLDTAWLHAFADVDAPFILDRWHTRLAPFQSAVEELLRVQPAGYSMRDMSTRYSIGNTLIANAYERQQRGKQVWNSGLKARFLDTWITRSDAQNYMVFGDPGARLRIPAG